MPQRSLLSATDRESLLAIPDDDVELIRLYSFSETDLALIRQRRGDANRFGFAVQLCLLRYPGVALTPRRDVPDVLIRWVARTLWLDADAWPDYATRDVTRRQHRQQLLRYLQLTSFGLSHFRAQLKVLTQVALQTDKGVLLASATLQSLRENHIVVPELRVIDRLCVKAIARANRIVFRKLTSQLSMEQLTQLDQLLTLKPDTSVTWLNWLRQSPLKPSTRTIRDHIDRLQTYQAVQLPANIGQEIHQNRLLKIAREGAQMMPSDLGKFEPERRHATLAALVIEGSSTVTDQIIDLHDRIMIKLLATARHKHQQAFQSQGKAINNKVRLYSAVGHALLNARESGEDPFAAIEQVITWDEFIASVTDADTLARPNSFDFLHLVADQWRTLRRYTPQFLMVLKFEAAPSAQPVLEAIKLLRQMNEANARSVPDDSPTSFVNSRWKSLVFTASGIDRRCYEICALLSLKNALRSGDIWVHGSRQFRNFEDYLIPKASFESLANTDRLPLVIEPDGDRYLTDRLSTLQAQLSIVNQRAKDNDLPDATFSSEGLKLTPQESSVPEQAQQFITRASRLLPRIKITDLLLEVDGWLNFTRHFVHLKTDEIAKDRTRLLTTILADGINLGLVKMAQASPNTTYSQLSWMQAWHIRDETYTAATAELVNAQLTNPFAAHWGDGTTSSSDGQRFRTGHHGADSGQVNPRYGSSPGRLFYTHISDQYSPFSTRVINVGVRDSTYVLDGLLYHESDLRIAEHYTDTAGFTDHVFGLMHLLGFRFAPRIRDLKDTRLYVPSGSDEFSALKSMIGGALNTKSIQTHWPEILRLATSIKQGSVTASLMIRKLSSYPRQNGLAVALRELGRIERSLFILDWLQNTDLRKRVHAGLNKGEARNALARAVFFNRLGEIRDRSFEQQRYRASGLNLITAAIVLWNTVYLERAISYLQKEGETLAGSDLLKHLSPLGWDHINLTGDYVWAQHDSVGTDGFRPLRVDRQD